MFKTQIKNLSFAIITHVYASGPAFKLEEFLVKKRVKSLLFIGHPFSHAKDTRSFIRIYHKGNLVLEKKFRIWRGRELTYYGKDLLLSLWWIIKYSKNIDYLIGVDNLNAFTGYLLKLIGKVKKVIFYTIDYIPQRTENKVLNTLYHFLDRLMVKKSEQVWNLSLVMVDEREKRGVDSKYRFKQKVVPIGTDKVNKTLKFDKNKFVFIGHMRTGQGLELLITCMADVIKIVPEANLLVIGGGPLENKLKGKVKSLEMENNIKFCGFIEKFFDIKKLIQDAAFAVAPYEDDNKSLARFTDPGKPKDYLASGLPVVITKVPQVAYEIDRRKCGLAINYNKDDLSKAIITLLTNSSLLTEMRRNALIMAREYKWDSIYTKALSQVIRN